MGRLRIILANGSLASYTQGGGHWSWFLQYPLGLRALGHEIYWHETLRSSGNAEKDLILIAGFFDILKVYGLDTSCCVLLHRADQKALTLNSGQCFGISAARLKELARDCDVLWNFACALRQPLISMFRRRALIDVDPGHLQVSALTCNMGIQDHDRFLTVGLKMRDADCEVPRLGVTWAPFIPFVYLPMWVAGPDPGSAAAVTSITHWNWGELWLNERVLSIAKRDAYLKYVSLPLAVGRRMELAANLHPNDQTGDRQLLVVNGWQLVDPWDVAGSVPEYQEYIRTSRAELSCPKPIHIDLKSGWFSDRSAAYLALGRPVLAEETGFSERIPVGRGLLRFRDRNEAIEAIQEMDGHYELHRVAAREIAEEYLDSAKVLTSMLDHCA